MLQVDNDNGDTAGPAWRRCWRVFITSGGRSAPDEPDYLRVTLLNLVAGVGFFVWLLFLCLNLSGVVESSTGRIIVDSVGIAVAVGVLIGLRAGAPVAAVAEIVHVFLFILLLGAAVSKTDNPLAITVPLIYPAVAFLLLDNVLRAGVWTLLMIISVNVTILAGIGPHMGDQNAVVDGVLSVSVAMFFQAAVMALYVHNRKQVMSRLRTLGAELSDIAVRDALTGLFNRRTFQNTVTRELGRRERQPRYFAFLLFDIDHFKAYNDTYGHPQGDRLIRRIAATTQSIFSRREDLVFRLGGEEFGVVYNAPSETNAAAMANRLVSAIENLNEPAPNGPRKAVTVSAGLFLAESGAELAVDDVFRRADEALYHAKQNGRARWVIADDLPDAAPVTTLHRN